MEVEKEMYDKLMKKAEHDDKMKAINKKSYQRRNAKIQLMLKKAKKAGIKVSESEVDDYLAMK